MQNEAKRLKALALYCREKCGKELSFLHVNFLAYLACIGREFEPTVYGPMLKGASLSAVWEADVSEEEMDGYDFQSVDKYLVLPYDTVKEMARDDKWAAAYQQHRSLIAA